MRYVAVLKNSISRLVEAFQPMSQTRWGATRPLLTARMWMGRGVLSSTLMALPCPLGFNWFNDHPTGRLQALPYPSDAKLRRIRGHSTKFTTPLWSIRPLPALVHLCRRFPVLDATADIGPPVAGGQKIAVET
jgi:hypothetical protein